MDRIQADGWPVLALRLDRIQPFSSTTELGQRRNLDVSPVTALAAVAQGGPSALVIDQLDALSLASGRMPTTFDVIIELLREARAFPEMRVILACREFDANNDHRIRALAATEGVGRIQVTGLSMSRSIRPSDRWGWALTGYRTSSAISSARRCTSSSCRRWPISLTPCPLPPAVSCSTPTGTERNKTASSSARLTRLDSPQ